MIRTITLKFSESDYANLEHISKRANESTDEFALKCFVNGYMFYTSMMG